MISRAAFRYAAKTPDSELYVIAASAIRDNNLDPSKDPAKHPDYPANVVLEAYHQFMPLFTKTASLVLLAPCKFGAFGSSLHHKKSFLPHFMVTAYFRNW